MAKNRLKTGFIAVILIVLAIALIRWRQAGPQVHATTRIINPAIGDVAVTVATTGVIEPQNRLEIKPSIGGRIDSILVREGDRVKEGDILAWMSSTERAALVDAARAQGEEALRYWEEAYKKTPVIAPINGEVIVRSVEPGQTVTASDTVLVLSDRLVVSAQFDETDIGKVKVGQEAVITLDAYPDVRIEGVVDHVAYESEIVNNVTIYDVDIIPESVPEIMRSGMSVTVEAVEKKSAGVLTIPSGAVNYDGKRQFVLVKDKSAQTVERDITVGLNDEKNAEVISGLTIDDKIVLRDAAYMPKKKNTGTNPFMPSRKR